MNEKNINEKDIKKYIKKYKNTSWKKNEDKCTIRVSNRNQEEEFYEEQKNYVISFGNNIGWFPFSRLWWK